VDTEAVEFFTHGPLLSQGAPLAIASGAGV
jgi:hypothetical protein